MKFPQNKIAAVVFSVDDVHPASIHRHGYEAGGDLELGVLGRINQLLNSYKKLYVTLFVTANWREKSPKARRVFEWFTWLPGVDKLSWLPLWRQDEMRLDLHQKFISYIKALPRTELGSHGLTHVGEGKNLFREFVGLNKIKTEEKLSQILEIWKNAELPLLNGFCPPGWGFSEFMGETLARNSYSYVTCSRDLSTPISRDAKSNESGLKGVSLIYPSIIDGIVHIPTNWSATNNFERAFQIVNAGGVLSIKAHAVKEMRSYTSADGLDAGYQDYLSQLFEKLETRYGNSLWWATMADVAKQFQNGNLS